MQVQTLVHFKLFQVILYVCNITLIFDCYFNSYAGYLLFEEIRD